MQKGRAPWVVSLAVAALGLSFWAGRTTSPHGASVAENPGPPRRSADRGNEKAASRVGTAKGARAGGIHLPADGNGPVGSALALRDIFKEYGGQFGSVHAEVALARMNADEIAALGRDLIASQAETPGYAYTLEITTTFNRWAELDPEAALKAALETKQRSVQSGALAAVFATMAKTDPELARQKIAALEDPTLRRAAQGVALQAIAARDPDTWVSWVKADPSLASSWSMDMIVSEWALDVPAATAARLKNLPTKLLEGTMASLGEVWAGKDPVAARAWAESLEDPTQRSEALSAVAGGMAAKDPDAAITSLAGLPPETRAKAMAGIFKTLGDLDFASAVDRLAAFPDPADRDLALAQLSESRGWTALEPAKLLGLLEGLPKGESRSNILGRIGSEFSQSSPGEIDQALKKFSHADQITIRQKMVETLSYNNPAKAIEILGTMPDSPQKNQSLQQAISYLGRSDPQEAIRQMNQLPAGQVRESAISRLMPDWLQRDTPAAIKWMESLSGSEQSSAMQAAIPNLVLKSPEDATRLYDRLAKAQEGSEQDGRLMNTARNLVGFWSHKDPAAAVKWAEGIEQENIRHQALIYSVMTWRQRDPVAARRAVEQMNVPDNVRESLHQQFNVVDGPDSEFEAPEIEGAE